MLFKGENIALCVNNETIVKCSIKDRQCNVVSKIVLPRTRENFYSYEIVDNICPVLDSQRLCILYKLKIVVKPTSFSLYFA